MGLGGLLPFLATAAATWLASPRWALYAVETQLWYAATILSFLGAVHWGLAFAGYGQGGPTWWRLGWGVTPSLIAFAGLLLAPGIAAALYIIAFAAAYFVDMRTVRAGLAPLWYPSLRRPLTAVVLICLTASLLRLRGL